VLRVINRPGASRDIEHGAVMKRLKILCAMIGAVALVGCEDKASGGVDVAATESPAPMPVEQAPPMPPPEPTPIAEPPPPPEDSDWYVVATQMEDCVLTKLAFGVDTPEQVIAEFNRLGHRYSYVKQEEGMVGIMEPMGVPIFFVKGRDRCRIARGIALSAG
jgi:hypothetical protein